MEAADQGSHDMAVGGMVVVAWSVEIGRHQADRIKAVLDSQCLAQFDASDLGDRIPLIGGLQWAGKQILLPDRLRTRARVDAAAA